MKAESGMSKVSTIAYGSVKEYATVPARLKEFREKNPRASVKSKPTYHEDGALEFETIIIVDKSDEGSADSNGHAYYTAAETKRPKSYEKLETISMGRALAKLGYLNDGQVATTEEMVEFNEYRLTRQEEKKSQAIEKLQATKTLDELKKTFISLGELMADEDVVKIKDEMKGKVENANH